VRFEWDEGKNRENVRKHGVSFQDAARAFLDPHRLIRYNATHSAIELRYYCFGRIGARVLTVRFTMRGQAIRIIGAGYWREGRETYEAQS
jgi:uncharacterized DUF497 family protein